MADFTSISQRNVTTFMEKQAEYRTAENEFNNFDAAADLCQSFLDVPEELQPLAIGFAFYAKQVVSAISLLSSGCAIQQESAFRDKLKDLQVYPIIFEMLYDRALDTIKEG